MLQLELLEPHARLACSLAIATALAQAPDDPAYLLLPVADRVLQCLTPLLLQFHRLLLLLLPALQQLLMQQFGARQQGRSLLCRLLLAAALIFEATDHLVQLPLAPGCEQAVGLGDHLRIQPQPLGNRQGVATAGDAPLQVIRGGEGVAVKGH